VYVCAASCVINDDDDKEVIHKSYLLQYMPIAMQ